MTDLPESPTPNSSRFRELLRKLLDAELSAAENSELDELLNSSAELRELYVKQIWTDSLLSWGLAEIESNDQVDDLPPEVMPEYASTEKKSTRTALFAGRSPAWLVPVVLVGLMLPGIMWSWPFPFFTKDKQLEPSTPALQQVAVLLDSEDAVWDHGNDVPYGTPFLAEQRLIIKSGLVRLAFGCGAGVVLEGPAELKLTTEWEAFLHRGKLAAIVPKGAEGFTVLTPQKRIVDLGTKFGASVNPTGEANVQVYEGQVKVESREPVSQEESLLLSLSTQAKYSESNSAEAEITLQGIDSEDPVSVPTLEQLQVARSGVYPPSTKKNSLPAANFPSDMSFDLPSTIAPSVILGEDFSLSSPEQQGRQDEIVERTHELKLDPVFARIVRIPEPLHWQGINGGLFALELDGRDPAYPSIANRMQMMLHTPIEEEVYFSFLGKYSGLDENDFFSLWFDSVAGEGTSHSRNPNAGIRFGEYFGRMTVEEAGYFEVPVDEATFCLVGKLSKTEGTKFNRIELWVNPNIEQMGEPDIKSQYGGFVHHDFRVIGIRMGKETEPTDRLWFDRLVVARSLAEVIVPSSIPPSENPSTF